MFFDDQFVTEVCERNDILSLVSGYVSLKRSGGNNYVGLCPFHSEKTPSFSVTPSKNMFYCFGCHVGGSPLTFIQKRENLDFPSAVEFLADRAGIPLPVEQRQGNKNYVSRNRVLEMNREAAKFFRACLLDEKIGKPGMDYFLSKRQLSPATITHFGLGYAPNSYRSLLEYMKKKGYNEEELRAAYLCAKSDKGSYYDIFRNRVMFPIIDTAGNVIAFGGRVLDDSKPKYLNTSDTPAFHKSGQLFALNFARNSGMEDLILCEGYMDVIALHAAGFTNAVATLGTAITPNHARVFQRYCKRVIISYDVDEAGQIAANKAMKILSDVGVETKVLRVENAKDPDEFIRKFGAAAFDKLLRGSKSGFDFKADAIYAKYDLSVGSEKIKAANELCAVIADYYSDVERAVYLDAVSKRIELPLEALQNTVKGMIAKRRREYRAEETRAAVATLKDYGDRINPDSAKDPRYAKAEGAVLGMMLVYDEYREGTFKGKYPLTSDDFSTEFHRRVSEEMMKMTERESYSFELFGQTFNPDEMGRMRELMVNREELTDNGEAVFRSALESLHACREKAAEKDLSLEELLKQKRKKAMENGGK